mgnify:CR=1 FL=1
MKEYKENFITVEKENLCALIFNEDLLSEKYALDINNINKVIYNKNKGCIYFINATNEKLLAIPLHEEMVIAENKTNIVSFIDSNAEAKHSLLLETE